MRDLGGFTWGEEGEGGREKGNELFEKRRGERKKKKKPDPVSPQRMLTSLARTVYLRGVGGGKREKEKGKRRGEKGGKGEKGKKEGNYLHDGSFFSNNGELTTREGNIRVTIDQNKKLFVFIFSTCEEIDIFL